MILTHFAFVFFVLLPKHRTSQNYNYIVPKAKLAMAWSAEMWNMKCVIRTSAYTDKTTWILSDIKIKYFLKLIIKQN
jgi:hypothetical protein